MMKMDRLVKAVSFPCFLCNLWIKAFGEARPIERSHPIWDGTSKNRLATE